MVATFLFGLAVILLFAVIGAIIVRHATREKQAGVESIEVPHGRRRSSAHRAATRLQFSQTTINIGFATSRDAHHGCSRLITHFPSGCNIYRKRSWSLADRPCQNSISVGFSVYPPQNRGRGTARP